MASVLAGDARLDDLEWMLPALWPDATPEPVVGRSGELWFVANPSPSDCRLLVPGGSNRAAAEAVRRYHDGASLKARATMLATEVALRAGATRLLSSRHVSLTSSVEGPGLIRHLSQRLGVEISTFAVTLGPRRANRKPVVQLFDGGGRTVGFAKGAVDSYTAALVDRETTWLLRAEAAGDPDLRVPAPLWTGVFGDWPVSVISPVWARRRPPTTTTPSWSLVDAIHRLTPVQRADVRSAAPALGLARSEQPDATFALELVRDRRATAELGAWHGDLTPWNLLSTGDGKVVIDWETAEDGMPRGADLLHREVAVAMQLRGEDAGTALSSALDQWPTVAADGGLDSDESGVVVDAILLEYVRRDLDLRSEGRELTGLGVPAMEALRRG